MAYQHSNQIIVTASGTAVQGDNVRNQAGYFGGFYLKAHPDNNDTVWFGNNGSDDVSSANGYPLDPGESIFVTVANLDELWFDADSNGDKICWYKA